MVSTIIQPPKTMQEVWESLPEGTLCQLINNKLIIRPAPLVIHQQILNEINVEISIFLRKNQIGKIIISPTDVHFSKENILQPDLLFIKKENLNIIRNKGIFGVPDMIIEVLSPSTSQFDFEEKKFVYERFGVEEYFIVDPSSKSVESFFLKNKEYVMQETLYGKISSKSLGTAISF